MSHAYADNLFAKSFTPKEPQVQLCQASVNSNLIISFINNSGKRFIASQCIESFINYTKDKIVLYVVNSREEVNLHADLLKRLSCFSIVNTNHHDLKSIFGVQVVVATQQQAASLLGNGVYKPADVGLFILFGCHQILRETGMQELTRLLYDQSKDIHILGIAGSLLESLEKPYGVETEVGIVEERLHCVLSTESDTVTILQRGARPRDYIVEFSEKFIPTDAEQLITDQVVADVKQAKDFLLDHRFEICEYDGFEMDRLKISDPAVEPLQLLEKFLFVLNNMGLYAANVAAYVILKQLEQLIIRTPYERHYLLLGVTLTLFVKIRAILDSYFEQFSKRDRLYCHIAHRVLRLFEIIKQFRQSTEKFYPPQSTNTENDLCNEKMEKSAAVNNDLNGKGIDASKPEECERNDGMNARKIENPTRNWRSQNDRRRKGDWRSARRGLEGFKPHEIDPHTLCGLIIMDDELIAQVIFYILSELKTADEEFSFLRINYTVSISDKLVNGALENAYKRHEQVLRNFRIRECNLLVTTRFIETGIDLPRCNLVVRMDPLANFRSYALGKARARGVDALHIMMASSLEIEERSKQLASYHAIEEIMMKSKAGDNNPVDDVEDDRYVSLLKPFRPMLQENAPYVDLNSALFLLNRYCAKLPSDTFTRLTPQWKIQALPNDPQVYVCAIRLPINSPIKRTVLGPAMPSIALACRFAALEVCLALHSAGELDDTLMPITKEMFWEKTEGAAASDVEEDEEDMDDGIIRPGTTKRRQYYNKRIAECLTDCRPVPGVPCYLYHISMTLTCPLPEEQNTRGRKIFAPESSPRGFGILTSKPILGVGVFPIFTRAGEVAVELDLSPQKVILDTDQTDKIVKFISFTFTSVLRLQKYLMMFDPDTSENSYFIVPTLREAETMGVDWNFLTTIDQAQKLSPVWKSDADRINYKFTVKDYEDAVVCPWYRNQDQPQYFYVAEICTYLTPKAAFPGEDYNTFETYYLYKYGIQIQDCSQALLDVDHTSARLNFLTPRYVNRKGVALPTTSEAKKRAKRENLGHKQILVPELCNVHPFPASLWQKAVCLPCILHRLNSLLLANQLRQMVAVELGLGHPGDPETIWKPLDFGWNLADVLRKSRETAIRNADEVKDSASDESFLDDTKETESESGVELEIGTWSNDLAVEIMDQVEIVNGDCRYSSPTSWLRQESSGDESDSMSESEFSNMDAGSDSDSTDLEEVEDDNRGLRIEFKTKDVAEAVETKPRITSLEPLEEHEDTWACSPDERDPVFLANKAKYEQLVAEYQTKIVEDGVLCAAEKEFIAPWVRVDNNVAAKTSSNLMSASADNSRIYLAEDFSSQANELPHAHFIKQSLLKHQLKAELARFRDVEAVSHVPNSLEVEVDEEPIFSFDEQPELPSHPGPSPSLILQALTMSNANDGINLERLETIGDSFLKYSITTYLYCTYENVHEGKLSHLRSKQVSNLNLYRLGKQKVFAENMIATKFEPHDNWLPPCYFVPRELERALIAAGLPASLWNRADLPALHNMTREEIAKLVLERSQQTDKKDSPEDAQCFIPYNLITQHSIPDKSIADCVEALIGSYLVACGPRGALLFMAWLGIRVLPFEERIGNTREELLEKRRPGHMLPKQCGDLWKQTRFEELRSPKPPLLRNIADPEGELSRLLTGFEAFEQELQYKFRDRCYLLQAVTHASYSVNQLTDCYQRLEFLGDAVLDYLITRYLFEDPRHHSPGSLTDLRSALVNNTIFASLAVRHGFHKFFRHQCPSLHDVLDRFVRIQQENNHAISDECYLVLDTDAEEAEDVEVPKALGDVFESIAGAIYLDSGMSLDAVWRVYYRIMKPEIEMFSNHVPKSPIRELLELEPETAQFGKPEKLADGRRVRVTVEVFGKGVFKGIGRNYRIAKCTAAKCALKQLRHRGMVQRSKLIRASESESARMEAIKASLKQTGQEQLLQFWNELSDSEKENLLKDIEEVNVKEAAEYFQRAISSPTSEKLDGLLQPVPEDVYGAVSRCNANELADLENEGLKQISDNKVGVLLLAGGQGTRLGVSYPKGMYDAGLPSHKPLFQIQAERIRKLQTMAKARFGRRCAIAWYIMTSDATMEKTTKFFEKNNYFGLEKENIVMFEQGMMPCFTLDGKIILDEKSRVSRSPDGNGGIYRALRDRGVLADMTRRGVRYLHAHSVDNILVKVADPLFIGFCVQRGADCGAKVVEKTIPSEPLGVVCSVNGAYQVVEYSEITPATAALQRADGRLTFHAGSICNHFFTTDFLLNVANEYESQLRLHVANKKIPYINEAGVRVTPEEPNGIKIEKFIFDVFLFAKNLVLWEVPREEEFSAIKNKEGTGKDDPATARESVNTLHRLYIERAGGKIEGDGLVEISPLLSYWGEGLEGLVSGKSLSTPVLLSAPGEVLQHNSHN